MGSIRETTEFGYCVKKTGGQMRGWPYECCHWYFVVCALPLSYLVAFSNHGFQFVTELETRKNKNLEGLFLVSFFSVLGRNLFFGITCFICQKNITYHLQISREEITVVCGF